MEPRIYILSGASRGLGRALLLQLLAPGHRLLTLARHADAALVAQASAAGADLTAWEVDLAAPGAVAERLQHWLSTQPPADATLINNAAALVTPGPLREGDFDELANAVRVGLEAPLLLSAAFAKATAGWPGPRRVLNISSGLGRRAMAGNASYCAIKAGLDHMSRALALDEADQPNGLRVVSLAPGVIDTDMQVRLRQADPARFPAQAQFAALKAEGQLDTPQQAAAKVLRYLARADFGDEPVADVRQA